MKNIQKYFDAPIFESSKSCYAVRYQNELELKLMQKFDSDPKIKTFFQPILTALVKDCHSDSEFFIHIDFWIEYFSGKIDLVYIALEPWFPKKTEIQIFTTPSERLKVGNFGFAVIRKNNLQRIAEENLKTPENIGFNDHCLINFDWVN